MSYDLSVIAPCYNESRNVIELTERLLNLFEKKGIKGEVILVNDASSDETGELINQLAEKFSAVQAHHHKVNQGIVSGWKTGLQASKSPYVCLIDSDLQNLPEDVGRLYKEILFSNVDLVQGWRNHIGRSQDAFIRNLATKGLNFLLNICFKMRAHDNKSGFILCRKEVLEDILNHKYTYKYYQTFITIAAKYKGYSIREIETLFQDRRLGKSFINSTFWASLGTLRDIAKGLFEFRFTQASDATLFKFLTKHQPKNEDKPLSRIRLWYWKLYILLFPLHHWMISYPAYKYYLNFKKSQWLTTEELKDYQLIKLRQLLVHAYYHVPFYREMFDKSGIRPEHIQSLSDLQKLPIIDKMIVRENLHLGIMSDNHDKKNIQKVQTSGSTGIPFMVYADKKQVEMRWAATQRSQEWTGYQFGDRQVRLWHKHLGMKPFEIMREVIDAFLTRRRFIPAYEITDQNLSSYVASIMKFKPVLLDGYAESFNLLARFLKHTPYNGHKPKGIMSSAQTMPPESRAIIENAFQCGVFDKYGGREFAGGIAYQCSERKGYHVVAECNIVEIIKDGRPAEPGEIGEIVVTELNNFAMPLIRYKIGDLAVQMDKGYTCPCGRGLPLIGEIQGRVQSIVIGTNNQFIPGTFFNRVFFKHDLAIRQYQIIQEKKGELIIKIIKGNLFNDSVLQEIFSDIRQHLGNDLKISVEYVDTIPLGRTGKHQYCISNVDPLEISNQLANLKV